jgi:hypothetical protein
MDQDWDMTRETKGKSRAPSQPASQVWQGCGCTLAATHPLYNDMLRTAAAPRWGTVVAGKAQGGGSNRCRQDVHHVRVGHESNHDIIDGHQAVPHTDPSFLCGRRRSICLCSNANKGWGWPGNGVRVE